MVDNAIIIQDKKTRVENFNIDHVQFPINKNLALKKTNKTIHK